MTNPLTPPITAVYPDNSGINGPITVVQNALRSLSPDLSAGGWLAQSLGRVKPEPKEKGQLPEPWIYKANGEYYPAYPNDTLPSFSCLFAHDDESIDGSGFFGKRTLSVIVWANLKTLNVEPPTVEGLKMDVIRALRSLYCVESIGKVFDQTPGQIYPGFDLSGFDTKFMSYPYGGFRVETVVHYTTNLCY